MPAKEEMKYFILTYGCQMNEHDSEKIAGQLEDIGFSAAGNLESADLIILNTCCVREKAEDKVRGKLGEIKLLKEKNPRLLVGIGGCMMQQKGYGNKFIRTYPYVNFVFGTHTLDEIPTIVERIMKQERFICLRDDRADIPSLPGKRSSPFRAWVSIIKGCQNFCTYCIVPFVRGKEVSRPIEEITEEVEELSREGVKEIVLLGQNVNAYGKDLAGVNFADLLRELDKIDGLKRIRYLTSHPRDFTKELVDTINSLAKVCEHFHLPIQSGSDKILKAMNRGYDQAHYLRLVDYIKNTNPNCSITTDFIVGFPGETDEDFQATLDVVNEVGYDAAFIFNYSPRRGTPAANIELQVADKVKKERLQTLMALQQSISLKKNLKLVGQTVEVLCEGASKKSTERAMGRTRTNKPVIIPHNCPTGDLLNIEIAEANAFTLYGKA